MEQMILTNFKVSLSDNIFLYHDRGNFIVLNKGNACNDKRNKMIFLLTLRREQVAIFEGPQVGM